MSQIRYVMLVDIKRCIGCHTCSLACKQNNNLPRNVWWNRVLTHGGPTMDTPRGLFPNLQIQFLTLNCQHCGDPACVNACPAGATYKNENGIVMQDYDLCLGCEMCIMACPYDGVRTYHGDTPEYYLETTVGENEVRPPQKGTISKCHFCYFRVEKGQQPNCIAVCPAKARYFGDINDASSEVSQLIKRRESLQLLEEKATGPAVYFLI